MAEPKTGEPIPSGLARTAQWYERLVTPRASGLPNLVVLTGPPIAGLVMFVVFVALGISGSSTGYFHAFFEAGTDPDLLAGTPRGVRSDEWLVQSSWIVSQVEQGFPLFNNSLPGGVDATIQNDLPVWDWSTIFRPHVWGFLGLPLDQGMAVRWWLPALLVFVFAYIFVVTILPRRPAAAVALAAALLLSPILQWWFLPATLWPVAWCFATLVALHWAFSSSRLWVRLVSAAAAGYLAVAMAMSIYVPFMVPAAVVVLCVAAFEVVAQRINLRAGWKTILLRLTPLAGAAAVALATLLIWVRTRWGTIEAVTSTVYPGDRVELTGTTDTLAELVALISAPFQRILLNADIPALGGNQSEAAAPLLLGVFLLIPAIAVALRPRVGAQTALRHIDWRLVGPVIATLLVLAFLLVPGWDWIAHGTMLDRSTSSRIRLAFALTGIITTVYLVRRVGDTERPAPWWSVLVAAGLTVGSSLVAFGVLSGLGEIPPTSSWIVVTLMLVAAVVAMPRGWTTIGAAALLVASALIGWGVNPLYSGVFDLRDTEIGTAVERLDEANPGSRWVGIGGFVSTATLVQSGVVQYNGVQTYPPRQMWEKIDPEGEFEQQWNRLANVGWIAGEGPPQVSNPVRDQILVTFDSCSAFAQSEVDFVLSEQPLDQPCIREVEEFEERQATIRIYEVVKKG